MSHRFHYEFHGWHGSVGKACTGVETGGSGGAINRGPELLGTPKSGARKFFARKEYATSEKLKN